MAVAHDVDRLCHECRLGVPQTKGDCATNAGCVMVAVSDACAGACAASAGMGGNGWVVMRGNAW
jgi:hypothetical protein